MSESFNCVHNSVGDPDPYPQDPHVFGLLDSDPDPLVRGTKHNFIKKLNLVVIISSLKLEFILQNIYNFQSNI